MSDQPETVNMSLDDVIKQNRAKVLASKKAVAKPKAKKVAAKKAVVAKKTSASKVYLLMVQV